VSRTVLGLAPLEAAVMTVAWRSGRPWLTIEAIRGQIDYPPAGRRSVGAVVAGLCRKGLLTGGDGPAWGQYRAARPLEEHVGHLIAGLLDAAPDPAAALRCALRRPVTSGGPGGPALGTAAHLPPRQRAGRTP
jgi:predicted transcriptional regulator